MKKNNNLFMLLLLLIVVAFVVAICVSCCDKKNTGPEPFTLHSGPADYGSLYGNAMIGNAQAGLEHSGPANLLANAAKVVAKSPLAVAAAKAANAVLTATPKNEGVKAGLHAVAVAHSEADKQNIAKDAAKVLGAAPVAKGLAAGATAGAAAEAAAKGAAKAMTQSPAAGKVVEEGAATAKTVKKANELAYKAHHVAAAATGGDSPVAKATTTIKQSTEKAKTLLKTATKTGSASTLAQAGAHSADAKNKAQALASKAGPFLQEILNELAGQAAAAELMAKVASAYQGEEKKGFHLGVKSVGDAKKATKVVAATHAGTPVSATATANPKHQQGDNLEQPLENHAAGSKNPVTKGKIDFEKEQRDKTLRGGTLNPTYPRGPRQSAGHSVPVSLNSKNKLLRRLGPENSGVKHMQGLLREKRHYGQTHCHYGDWECLANEPARTSCSSCNNIDPQWKGLFSPQLAWNYSPNIPADSPYAGQANPFFGGYVEANPSGVPVPL